MILRALSVGLSGALIVGLMKLVDGNHQEPARVVLGYMAATAFWFAILTGAWIAARNYVRRRKAGL
jgi:thiamine transporter ThiT